MNISIDDNILKEYDLSLEEFLILYLSAKEIEIESAVSSLIAKKLLDKDLTHKSLAIASDNTKDLVSGILIESDRKVINSDIEFLDIAKKMAELFPTGRKPGTTYYWRDSTAVIARKLKTLVAKFDFHFTEDEAIDATKRYIESFKGDYQYMQLLKYFILKTLNSGEIKSDFMSLIENKGQDSSDNDANWMCEVK